MRKLVCIVAGDPNSINSEIIAKLWKKKSDILSLSGMLTFEERRRAMGFN